jgi:DUF4097 and DUF4098 domain-containing protein YvlB
MKRKILISLGVFVILVVAWFFVTLVLADFDFKLVFGVDERTPDSLSYYEEIKEIQIGVASDNVILKKTESSFVNIDYYKSKLYEYEFSVEDGILKIKQKRIRFTIFQISKSRNLEIALPGDLEKVSIGASSGDLSLTGISVKDLAAHTSSGDIALSALSLEIGEIHASSGSVSLNGVVARTLDIATSSGDVTLKNVTADTGKIKASSGDFDFEDTEIKLLDLMTSSGDVTCKALVFDACEVFCSSGNVQFSLSETDAELYRLKLTTASGKITVSGGGYNLQGSKEVNLGSGPKLLTVRVSSGNITVNYE